MMELLDDLGLRYQWQGEATIECDGGADRSQPACGPDILGDIRLRELILNWFRAKGEFSSGAVEGLNNKIGALQRRAYGFRNYEHLKLRLLTLHHTRFTLKG